VGGESCFQQPVCLPLLSVVAVTFSVILGIGGGEIGASWPAGGVSTEFGFSTTFTTRIFRCYVSFSFSSVFSSSALSAFTLRNDR